MTTDGALAGGQKRLSHEGAPANFSLSRWTGVHVLLPSARQALGVFLYEPPTGHTASRRTPLFLSRLDQPRDVTGSADCSVLTTRSLRRDRRHHHHRGSGAIRVSRDFVCSSPCPLTRSSLTAVDVPTVQLRGVS
ncbi:hypothetical protein BIW11_04447 [Tropilaelaps mercedesae]|uniref:Uncharacterized protein n=1 Tax=Tropilaelaps mercedesae TaxID=418985 RepID=A0A1V9X6Q3_9ACAR|nr:hypothetical protein BIW11_04447 [Tropilaelaps mercedesae]